MDAVTVDVGHVPAVGLRDLADRVVSRDPVGEILVVDDAGVGDRDDHAFAPDREFPGLGTPDHGVVPLLGIAGIVGNDDGVEDPVGLDVGEETARLEPCGELPLGHPKRLGDPCRLHEILVGGGEVPQHPRGDQALGRPSIASVEFATRLDDQVAGELSHSGNRLDRRTREDREGDECGDGET